MTPEEVKNSAIKFMDSDSFWFNEFDNIQKPKVWYVILVNGKRIKLGGKTMWNGIGAAKTGLKFSMKAKLFKIKKDSPVTNKNGAPDFAATTKAFDDAIDEWVKNHVAFVPFDDYMKIRKKRETNK